MDWFGIVFAIPVAAFLCFALYGIFSAMYLRRQWRLLELMSTLAVGTLPLGLLIQYRVIPDEISSNALRLFMYGVFLILGMLWSFAGTILGDKLAKFFKTSNTRSSFICMVLGWVIMTLILIVGFLGLIVQQFSSSR